MTNIATHLFYYQLIVKSILFFDSKYTCFRGDIMFYQRLRDLREDHDLVQKEIADILGIDQRVYSNYETGKRELPTHHLIKLAEYYNTSTDYILGLTNNPAANK